MENRISAELSAFALRLMRRREEDLGDSERRALERTSHRRTISEDPNLKLEEQATLGERLADQVARFGGSWTFISIFAIFLFVWAILNTEVLGKTAFDPYPYIFLNLMLSMLAAIQAPIIMMSQNRQSSKDRQMASHDYEVNLKAEIEIMALHEKFDTLRSQHLLTLIAQQQEQLTLLTRVLQHAGLVDPRADNRNEPL